MFFISRLINEKKIILQLIYSLLSVILVGFLLIFMVSGFDLFFSLKKTGLAVVIGLFLSGSIFVYNLLLYLRKRKK